MVSAWTKTFLLSITLIIALYIFQKSLFNVIEQSHFHRKPWPVFVTPIEDTRYRMSIVPSDPLHMQGDGDLALAEQGFGSDTWTTDNIDLPTAEIVDKPNPIFTSEQETVHTVEEQTPLNLPPRPFKEIPIPMVKKTNPQPPIINAVMSPWSEWSVCNPWGTRQRTRLCLRQGRNSGNMCGSVLDEVPCI